MIISVLGTGYVGLVTGACFAEMGNTVACIDTDARKIAELQDGRLTIHEPGLQPLLASNMREGRLRFSTSLAEAAAASDIHFITVGTPSTASGAADLQYVEAAAHGLGKHIARDCLVVHKSTAPVGTADSIRMIISNELDRRGVKVHVEVVSNPEFLKEGSAVNDFLRPERIIVGAESDRAVEAMRMLYEPFTHNKERLIRMSIRDAEMTKYASNAMLATRISFMNEIANVCEKYGVDVENVRRGLGADSRIGPAFIYAGCGYGGACFPKDLRALIHLAESAGVTPGILRAVEQRNTWQKERLFEKICERFTSRLAGRIFGIWGLSFKPGTDDVREAPSLALVERLIGAGAQVKAYDPVAMDSFRDAVPQSWFDKGQLALVANQYEAVAGADGLALVTEWRPFRLPDLAAMKRAMKLAVLFDGRNQFDPKWVRAEGFEYFGIGR